MSTPPGSPGPRIPSTFPQIPMCRQLPLAHPRSRRSPRLVDNGSFLVVRLQAKTGAFVRSTANGNVLSPASAATPGGVSAAVAASATATTPADDFFASSSTTRAATAVEGHGNPGGGGAAARCGGGGGGGAVGAAGGRGGGGVAGGGWGGGGRGASGGRKEEREEDADDRWILMMHEVSVCFAASGRVLVFARFSDRRLICVCARAWFDDGLGG